MHEDDDGCAKLKDLLRKHGMEAHDYSITKDKPNQAKSEEYIKSQILAPQIRQCSTLVVYLTENTKHSIWVKWEVEYAEKIGKRVVAVYAYGQKDCEIPDYIDESADAIVGWSGKDIIDAINGENQSTKPDGSGYGIRQIEHHDC